jgi:hypothetical protein
MKSTILTATALALMLALASGATARSGAAIQNYDNVPVVRADNAVLTSARVRQAIVGATLQGKGHWTILEEAPGRIVATFTQKKHSLTVEIRYSATEFSIVDRGSSSLKVYNKQVKALVDAINASLQRV